MGISERPSAILTSLRRQWGGSVVLWTPSICLWKDSGEGRCAKAKQKLRVTTKILYALRTIWFVVRKFGAILVTLVTIESIVNTE